MTPVVLGPGVRAAIEQHGRETYPHECCGALLGDGDRIVATHPLPNVTTEGPRRRFRIDDKDYLASERQASAAGLALLGFYHSHPDHPAEPSQYDLDHAWPTFVYPIVSVRDGRARGAAGLDAARRPLGLRRTADRRHAATRAAAS